MSHLRTMVRDLDSHVMAALELIKDTVYLQPLDLRKMRIAEKERLAVTLGEILLERNYKQFGDFLVFHYSMERENRIKPRLRGYPLSPPEASES